MKTICNYLEDFNYGDMILYRPYEASRRTIALIVKGSGWKLYILVSIWLRNRKRNDGLLSCLSSGLWMPFPAGSGLCLLCSLSVGIWIVMKRVLAEGQNEWEVIVRWLKRMEHFNYTGLAYQIFIILVASQSIKGRCPPFEWLDTLGSGTICHTVGAGRLSFGTRSGTIWPNKRRR